MKIVAVLQCFDCILLYNVPYVGMPLYKQGLMVAKMLVIDDFGYLENQRFDILRGPKKSIVCSVCSQ